VHGYSGYRGILLDVNNINNAKLSSDYLLVLIDMSVRVESNNLSYNMFYNEILNNLIDILNTDDFR
jgi:hypothetical protein